MLGSGSLRRLVFGHPLPSSRMKHERLGVPLGLAVFASDAISSVAYATEEILLALMVAGPAALGFSSPIGIVIVVVIAMVVISYQQVIKAHPEGGGAYTVALKELGRLPGLIAGAALLVDYVLTVAVSVTAGIENLASAWAPLRHHHVLLCTIAILLLMWMNLRGVRESAKAVSGPVFVFIGTVIGLIAIGVWRVATGHYVKLPTPELTVEHPLNTYLILHAFASGCVALTGIEAVSNGVQAFKDPPARNARITLALLGGILATFFIGLTFLAHQYNVVPRPGEETVLSLLGRNIYGENALLYYVLQISTLIILLLAANTSFAGFPRLASLLAQDGYLPRQLANLGDRLVFSNGIIVLGAMALALVFIFGGSTHALIPLYAIGVFLSFTLAQAGMLRRWLRQRPKGWIVGTLSNGIGGAATAVVLVVVTVGKLVYGAWIVVLAIPLIVRALLAIRSHYDAVAGELTMEGFAVPDHAHRNVVVIPIASLHRGTYFAVDYAKTLGIPVKAAHVIADPAVWEDLQQKWRQWWPEIPLVGLASPYRSLVDPMIEFVREQRKVFGRVTVVIPEFVVTHWWQEMLHNQSAITLDLSLRRLSHVSVLNFRYQLSGPDAAVSDQDEPVAEAQVSDRSLRAASKPPAVPHQSGAGTSHGRSPRAAQDGSARSCPDQPAG
jgi:amino acid transporter